MVMEPFSIIYFKILGAAATVTQTALSSRSRDSTLPVPSTWPLTICPPSRSQRSRGRSRFTLSPGLKSPRFVLRIDSAITSASKVPEPSFVTVRHTPFVQILSPSFVPSRTLLAAMVNTEDFAPCFTPFKTPISSIIPVNTLLTFLL